MEPRCPHIVYGCAEMVHDGVFKDANFLDDNPIFFDDPQTCKEAPECYHHLLAFFRLLLGEGVKAVWFDSLCINRFMNDEKKRKIARMGEYDEHSKG
ncbi:hypothetical protein GOP47_0013364 [Adiantum capillus-veneris]|uniref:Heterokaryon incompatibility domain-containing protein n=1 Tax=Adiantum capillus-veneris TaxID=13818 RepID=A0A9D4UND2_ADICA|nr:hypothetical protein GOP47_0030953 [Adiantum capillus-veneris]KAI5071113.1 hypothetical protein GOP47_0013364 [Adiantum capillus-veneris]